MSYEEAELEARDLTCCACDKLIPISDYYDYEGYCEDCWMSFSHAPVAQQE